MTPLKLIKTIMLASALIVFAQKTVFASEYKLFYTDAKGTQIEATEATLKALNKEQVYKCQAVELKTSKSGTSMSLRNVKKPKPAGE